MAECGLYVEARAAKMSLSWNRQIGKCMARFARGEKEKQAVQWSQTMLMDTRNCREW